MKFTRLKRTAQMPPMGGAMPPDPTAGAAPMGMPPAGAAGMPTSPMAMPGGGATPDSAATRQEIPGPLDTLAKIMYDDNITEMIDESGMEKPEDLSMKVWTDYGGLPNGKVDPNKVGTRSPEAKNTPQEQVVQENSKSDQAKWTRLPQGKTIQDVAPLDAISQTMVALIAGTAKNSASAAGGGEAGGAGGSGGASASVSTMVSVRLAKQLDKEDCPRQADYLDYFNKQKIKG